MGQVLLARPRKVLTKNEVCRAAIPDVQIEDLMLCPHGRTNRRFNALSVIAASLLHQRCIQTTKQSKISTNKALLCDCSFLQIEDLYLQRKSANKSFLQILQTEGELSEQVQVQIFLQVQVQIFDL